MVNTSSRPRVLRNQQNTQLSYELCSRIHTAKTYPIPAPNGSTVVIYGQENGVKIVWRGGRSFKAPQESSATLKGKTNGTHDAVVLLDSDDEDTSSPPFEDKPEFEDEEVETDPSHPYPGILQVLDLYFGTDVLHLALLPASTLRAEGLSWRTLEPLKQKIVFAAACADSTVRLVTLPLTPPSPLSKARPEFRADFTAAHAKNGKWGETVTLLNGLQKPADGVSLTADTTTLQGDVKAEAHLVVASHSREITGLLLLYRVPVKSLKSSVQPYQTIHLHSPATSVTFNPSLSHPRSSQLLVADTTGACRIYDFKELVKAPEDASDNVSAEQGSWLLSLYPKFQKDPQLGTHASFGRKTIIDAKWVAGGGAVICLLTDGEWVVWDIEGVGPGSSHGLLGRQAVKGGSRTPYSISGWLENASKATLASTNITRPTSKFAPMTPFTRKSVDLFSNSNGSSKTANTGHARGQISVLELVPSSSTSPAEESVVFWFGETFAVIPSLAKYWAANARKGPNAAGGIFSGTQNARLIKLDGVDLHGELCSGIDQIARPSNSTGLPTEVIILGEHRFTILSSGKTITQPQLSTRKTLVDRRESDSGDLDVIGIDQALARMESSGGNGFVKQTLIQR